MTTETFKSAIRTAQKRPTAVLVSLDLFRALDAEKALDRKTAVPWGVPGTSLGLPVPVFDSDVIVTCDPALDHFEFKLPAA